MDENVELEISGLPNNVQTHIQQIVRKNSNLSSQYAKELERALTKVAVLPFEDEIQRRNFFEKVQSLQGYHIIKIFNLGVAPRHKSAKESSTQILEDVTKIFDICISFCYTSDVSKRVSFDLYLSALKFCFPPHNEQSLPITVLSLLLELVQTFQRRKTKAELEILPKNRLPANTWNFFGEILDVFEKRRHDGYLLEIIYQTARLATADEKLAIKLVDDATLQGKKTLSSLLLVKWINLLKSPSVSNCFAVSLAEIDPSGEESEPFFSGEIWFGGYEFPYQSTILYFWRVLEEINMNCRDLRIPNDKDRMEIFFSQMSHFCVHPDIAILSLHLLVAKSISNEVLRQTLEVFFQKHRKETGLTEKASELNLKVLRIRPDGELLKEIVEFWLGDFSNDPGHAASLVCLLGLFGGDPNNERETAKRIFNFLERLPRPFLVLIPFWHEIFCWLMKIFPESFDLRPEVLALIQNAAVLASQVQGQLHFANAQVRTVQFLRWLRAQGCTEEAKSETILLLTSITQSETVNHRRTTTRDMDVLTSLHFCEELSFSSKENVVRELVSLEPRLEEEDQEALKLSIESILSSPDCAEEIFCEIFALVKNFVDGQGPKTTAKVFFEALRWLSTVPISYDRRLKMIRNFCNRESEIGFKNFRCILSVLTQAEFLREGDKSFDLLVHVVLETFKSDFGLCEQLCCALESPLKFPSSFVLKVWTCAVAGLISLGLYKKNIDSFCCLPVLRSAHGFDSPFEVLQLLFLARSTALTLSRRNLEANLRSGPETSSQSFSIGGNNHLRNFVHACQIILVMDTFSTTQKMLLVVKVRNVILCEPQISTALTHALMRLIPYVSSKDKIHAKFDRIIAILSNPKLLNELSRIPKAVNTNDIVRVVARYMFNVSSEVKSVEVLLFIASLQDKDEKLLTQLLSFVEMAIKISSSMEDALEVLKELVYLLRQVETEMIPFMLINFASFIGNPVDKQERDKFLLELSMWWESSPSHVVLSVLEVPRLLWKVYSTISNPAKRGELIGRAQEIICRNETSWHEWMANENYGQFLVRLSEQIACCELEWLVFHSPLSNEDAALAFDLSRLFFRTPGYRLRSSSFFDVTIKDGGFKFCRDERAPEVLNGRTCATPLVEEESMLSDTKQQGAVLIPVLMAQKVILCLTRLLGPLENLAENALSVWKLVCKAQQEARFVDQCGCDFLFDDYLDIFESILEEASSKEIVFLWASQNPHHAVQWSVVVFSARRWQRKEIKDTDNDAVLNFQTLVSTTLRKIRPPRLPCFRNCESDLKHLSIFLERRLPIEVTKGVLELYQVDTQAGVIIGEIVSSWSSIEQSLTLLEKVRSDYRANDMIPTTGTNFVLQLLKSFTRHGMLNTCQDFLSMYEHLKDIRDSEDPYGLKRLPTWIKAMMEAGDYTTRSIDSWCVAFLNTPLVDLKSRDIDAIVSLDFDALQLVASVSETIKRVIFPEDGFQVTEGEGIKSSSIRERIQLAKVIGDFIEIVRLLKPSENPKATNVTDIVVGACNELCATFEGKSGRKKSELCKIRGQALKAIFTEVFLSEKESKDFLLTNQEDQKENPTPSVLRNKEHLDPVLEPLLRRWLLGIVGQRPSLASITLEILQLLPPNVGLAHCPNFQAGIQARILSFERNQSLMAQLQAVGYNGREQDNPDLWSSPNIKLSGFLSNRESSSRRTYRKKLTEVLRFHWYGWTDLLSMFKVESVEVGGVEVRREDLFGSQASLEEMEDQVAAVKERARKLSCAPVNPEFKSSPEGIDRWINDLLRREQQYRRTIAKQYDPLSIPDYRQEMKEFAAVWENRFLEQVNQCSERIPGCYAPNGFHTEKPVICALSVDNRILTVFKEESGEEIENVEVKLFEGGMFVYDLHTSGHDYVTDELWAAFYKMLLEKRLVPRIVLSPGSPGFYWIRNFVTPDTSLPYPEKWELHTGIVPKQEDVFDYLPTSTAMWQESTEFITLTTENVAGFQFSDFKDASIVEEKEKRTKQMAGTAIEQLQLELKLLHGDDEPIKAALVKRLTWSIKETVKGILDGAQPTLETVKELTDMDKLAFRLPEVKRSDKSKQQYATCNVEMLAS
ncbi:uncharacterized protein LOC111342532 [Stylophora pistillata]|uniref:uncharacterized protein LOC111342532 n=1 Tax=Stylophora pistillata TaxID=50429 RepID=UPI000C03F3F5|nr:uncharacterized protein LOC111342532 [Stylophora pistillata]